MLIDELREKVREWDSQNTDNIAIADAKYTSILSQIEYHAANEWKVYVPAEHPDFSSNYMDRLAAWIGNLTSEDDQKLLLEYALYISFFSHEDFIALYRTAFNREILQWVASQIKATLDKEGWQKFHEFVYTKTHRHTWFCPVTDSMDINEFYKVNHISGISYRPGFAALQMMAEHPKKPNSNIADIWTDYMACPNDDSSDLSLNYLVLLEDIVGSGTQCLNAVRWAVEHIGKPVLFIPLIACPKGIEKLRKEEDKLGGQLTVRPVIELNRNDLLGPEGQKQNDWPITERLEDLIKRCADQASYRIDPFGYKRTGCSLATFSNTPNNTLPIVHNKPDSGEWNPLFPRVYRD